MNIQWRKQPFTVKLLRATSSGFEEYTEEKSGFVAVGVGLGYWVDEDGIAGDVALGTHKITHLASGLRIASNPRTDEQARRSIEAMTHAFTWNCVNFAVDWNLSSEELQKLPYWGDIQAIRRENWSPLTQEASC